MSANPAEIRAELERILASPMFCASARSVQFLRFCVEQSLCGNQDQIKETTVALQVFGRNADYNPRTDPIVRVHARRLRDKLEHYYKTDGVDSPIQITMPKGTYVPQAVRALPKSRTLSVELGVPRRHAPGTDVGFFTGADAQTVPQTHAASTKPPVRWVTGLAVALLSSALLILFFLWFKSRSIEPQGIPVAGEALPFNALPGEEQNPSWSPDGKALAFSWSARAGASPRIFIQRAGQSEPFRLTQGTRAEFRPVWSPNGREIVFLSYVSPSSYEVVRAPLNGGTERTVGVFSCPWISSDDLPALDWSPDGRSLLVAEQPSSTSPIRLILFDLSTGTRKPLTNPPAGNSGDIDGKFSPEGSEVAFRRGGLGDLYLVSTEGEANSPALKLTPDNPGVRGIAWSRDGRHILFGSMKGGLGWGIWQVNVDGSALTRVLGGSLNLSFPAVSPTGKTLAAEQQDIVTNLMEVALRKTGSSRLIAPSSRQDYSPVYSPDGRKIVFVSTRSGAIELWLANTDGTSARQLTQLNGSGFPVTPSWSPDSHSVLFAIRRNGATNVWMLDVSAGANQQLTFSQNRNINPVFGPDGKYIYFNSNDGGMPRIWRIPARGDRRAEEMLWDAPWAFQMSWTDRSLFFENSGTDLQIVQRNVMTGAQRVVFHSNNWVSAPPDLCVHKGTLYLMVSPSTSPSTRDLLAVDAASGKAQILKHFDVALPDLEFGCSVSPDGGTLLVPMVQRAQSDIYEAPLK